MRSAETGSDGRLEPAGTLGHANSAALNDRANRHIQMPEARVAVEGVLLFIEARGIPEHAREGRPEPLEEVHLRTSENVARHKN